MAKSRLLARWLRFLQIPILGGPLRGKLWMPASGGKILRHLFGTYEPELTQAFKSSVRPGDVVYDVGAHLGHFTLLSSMLVGDEGHTVAFEPVPDLAFCLERHVQLNRLNNVTVIRAAAGGFNGMVRFESRTGSGTGHVAESGDIEVPQRCLDDVAAELDLWPTHVKIDVEGYGHDVLCGAAWSIGRYHPCIFLTVHNGSEREACTHLLAQAGYHISTNASGDLLCRWERQSTADTKAA